MKLLVLDSSGLVASVALIEDDRLIAEYTTGNKLTHSQTLLPMLDEVIKRTSFEMEDIDAIAVAKGPGSFTGLRIGAATAKGLGLALKEPMYVMDVDIEKNQVVLGRNEDLFSKRLVADDVNLISIGHIDTPIRVTAKVRYRHTEAPATVNPLPDGKIEVIFNEPQRAITKGQAVVLYDGDIVVGGGTICETEKLY